MCLGGSGKAAKEAKKEARKVEERENKRQSDILVGRQNIDQAFGQFDQPFFNNYMEAYKGNYFPGLDEQYERAKGKLTAALFGRGLGESTIGIDQQTDLAKKNNEARLQIGNDAQGAANDLRKQVEQNKTNLYSLNEASADPQAAMARAQGAATSLAAPASYSPLGDVFSSFLGSLATTNNAFNNTPVPYKPPALYSSGSSSAKVIR